MWNCMREMLMQLTADTFRHPTSASAAWQTEYPEWTADWRDVLEAMANQWRRLGAGIEQAMMI